MFKNLKRKALRKQTDKNLRNRDFSDVNSSLKTLGFLVNEMQFQDFESLYNFSKQLGIQRKDVRLFSFVEFKKKAPSLRQDQLTNKDVSWNGIISNGNAREFLDKPFDVLIGYYEGPHEFLDLLVSESKAKFKVGAAGGDERLFDLILGVAINETETFQQELKKYLTVLKKI